ncbi:PBECR2 nuclease fold domain-containing protein [Helicobacter felis]|uniref:PBECR2 nuclease fold domain-containing protein n=1 Tax=Helicobacter felis TaxID=214 RepID=UPI000CF121C4|nr:PBECR2 nuclease fold domain-containing protein [Helicobacter felis]
MCTLETPPPEGGGKPPHETSEDLLDPKRPLRKANPEEITPELLEEVKKRNAKIWVGDLTNAQILEHLGLDAIKPIKMLFDGDALEHIEKRHGKGSNLVEISKQPAVTIEDRIVSKKNNALNLKTLYKENGLLEKNRDFSGAGIRLSKDNGNTLEASPSTPLDATSPNPNSTTFVLKESKRAWLGAFHLKSLDEPFIPQFSPAVQQALEPVLKEEQIQLTRGSLVKLAKRQRKEFLPLIRPALEEPNVVLRQVDGALIFVKDFGGTKFFASVARGDSGEWVITSNAPKTLNNLKNKISEGGEVLISNLPGLPIIARSHDATALSSGASPKESNKLPLKTPK